MDKENKQKIILIAEDDDQQSEPIKIALEAEGFKVYVAKDGKTCIELFKEHNPDLILLDMMLPEINGVKVLEEIRSSENSSNIPIIILSNLSTTEVVSKTLDLDVKEYFVKSNESLSGIVSTVKKKLNL